MKRYLHTATRYTLRTHLLLMTAPTPEDTLTPENTLTAEDTLTPEDTVTPENTLTPEGHTYF